MSKRTVPNLAVLLVVLAACAEQGPSSPITSPDLRSASTSTAAEVAFSATADGPFDVYFGGDDAARQPSAVSQSAGAQSAGAQSAGGSSAGGSRASGHVGFTFSAPTFGLLSERYSFVALSTDPTTLAAKGQFEMMLTAASGVEQRFHGDVLCMNTVGNTTRLAGILTKVWINNVQRPITGATHVIWTVVDNGEGQPTTDTASPMFFNNVTNAQTHCTTGFSPVQFTPGTGNVQVQP